MCTLPVSADTPSVTARIEVSGIEGDLLKNALASLGLQSQKDHPRLSAVRIKRLFRQGFGEIEAALKPYGYYRSTVTGELSPPADDQKEWVARYSVDAGDALKVEQLDIEIHGGAEQEEAFQVLLGQLPIKTGMVLNQPQYEQSKQALLNLAEELGYFDARYQASEIRIDEVNYVARIALILDSGERYRFGAVDFQQDTFSKTLLQRYQPFSEGDFYTASALLAFNTALLESGYFEKVQLTTDRLTGQQQLAVNIALQPYKPNRYYGSIGFGTDTGGRIKMGWERRYINRHGHKLNVDAALSQKINVLRANYIIPRSSNKSDFLQFSGRYEIRDYGGLDVSSMELSAEKHRARQFDLPGLGKISTEEILSLVYLDETSNYSNLFSDRDAAQIQGITMDQHSTLLMPGISWLYSQSNDPVYATHGQNIRLSLRGAISNLGSQTSFLQTRLSAVFIRSIGESGRMILRGDTGYTWLPSFADGNFDELPYSIRFSTGGDRSIRGFSYEELRGKRGIGTRHLLVGSAEYDHRLMEKWSAAAFYDVGNAIDNFSDSFKHSVGIGARWLSPVGLVRLDLAFPVSNGSADAYRVHLTVGPEF